SAVVRHGHTWRSVQWGKRPGRRRHCGWYLGETLMSSGVLHSPLVTGKSPRLTRVHGFKQGEATEDRPMSQAADVQLGSIGSLWRYPVKSMMGEELNAAEGTERGLRGDRAYALVDRADGKVASAKNPRTWPTRFDLRATCIAPPSRGATQPPARIVLPLARLGELYPQGRFEVRRFRPNIVVMPASGERSFVENAWVGQRLAIGEGVRLSVTGPCVRCVMTTLAQGDLPKDPEILRTAAQHNHVHVGVYAAVVRGGTIRRGDALRRAA